MRVIAIVNQKGGCGKTTTAVNLAGALAADGFRVLVLDLDPQAHATLALGRVPEDLDANLYDVLVDLEDGTALQEVLVPVASGLDLGPSSIVLSALEQKLAADRHDSRTRRLARALSGLPPAYDFVLVDCPPNVGLLTFNALRAAGEVIVPLETSFFAIDGVQKLLETIGLLSDRIGHDLQVRILATLYDGRTRFARRTLGEIRELFKDLCFDTVIRQNVKLRESSQRGVTIDRHAPSANGALDYAALAVEVAASVQDQPAARAEEPEPPAAAVRPPAPAPAPAGGPAGGPAPAGEALREVTVRFRDPRAGDVRIAGDFNGWIPDRGVTSRVEAADGARVWTKILRLRPGRYQYRYVVDGEWREDPASGGREPAAGGWHNSVLVVD